MQLGPTNLYKCPFCGKEKQLLSLISGNTPAASGKGMRRPKGRAQSRPIQTVGRK